MKNVSLFIWFAACAAAMLSGCAKPKADETPQYEKIASGQTVEFYGTQDASAYIVGSGAFAREIMPYMYCKTRTYGSKPSSIYEYNGHISVYDKGFSPVGSLLGFVLEEDTAAVNRIARSCSQLDSISGFRHLWGMPVDVEGDKLIPLYAVVPLGEPSVINASAIDGVKFDFDPQIGQFIEIAFNEKGAKEWENMTRKYAGNEIIICVNNVVQYVPRVNSAISGGKSQITGGDLQSLYESIIGKKVADGTGIAK